MAKSKPLAVVGECAITKIIVGSDSSNQGPAFYPGRCDLTRKLIFLGAGGIATVAFDIAIARGPAGLSVRLRLVYGVRTLVS